SDFIVGHPGESEQIWEEAVENFKKFPLTHLHCFVYSPRKDTISANLDGKIEPKIAKDRLKMLKNIVSINNFKFRQKQSNLEVLVESKGKDGLYSGFDQYYNKIKIQTNENLHNKWVNLQKYEVKFDENYAEI
nr:tRNA (N(6)-L-threonylcarbamoyladenosine(37)-C(2))-methylthiotransferase MtaB [Campylobacter sp.]